MHFVCGRLRYPRSSCSIVKWAVKTISGRSRWSWLYGRSLLVGWIDAEPRATGEQDRVNAVSILRRKDRKKYRGWIKGISQVK